MQSNQYAQATHSSPAIAAKPKFGKLNLALLVLFTFIGMAIAGLAQERVEGDLTKGEAMLAQLKADGVSAAEIDKTTNGAASTISRVRTAFNGTLGIVALALVTIVLAVIKRPVVMHVGLALIVLAVVGAFIYPAGGGGENAGAALRTLGYVLAVPFALAGIFAALGGRKPRQARA